MKEAMRKTVVIPWIVVASLVSFTIAQPSGQYSAPRLATSTLQPSYNFIPTNGPIDDAQCTIEDLEQANDSQLYSILMDLRKTNFFNTFVVDLSARCPLQTWRKGGLSVKEDDHIATDTAKKEEEEDDDDFECPSAKKFELDPDTPSLCTVHGDAAVNPFETLANPFESNSLLFSLSKDGFQSKEQQQTFEWKQETNMVVNEDAAVGATSPASSAATSSSAIVKEEECGNEQVLPDSFWLDMCSSLDGTVASSGNTIVNLALNPEHNTGYNGTHIWKAIYEENCAAGAGNDDKSMCLEERVLYRMLSGLHTSTTVSIAMRYNPPSVRKNRKDWQPNATYFFDKLGNHPDFIRNLHFSYVVLLRALQKASPFLYEYDIRTGDIVQDETAEILLKRLLDSAILTSCQSVFSGFDESKLWLNTTSFPSTSATPQIALEKETFKGIFHNISSILDCVQCQQCKLHGKMSMLGYGTALRILFTSSSTSVSPALQLGRNEIVALVNTLAKLSESIKHVRELTHLYWEEHGMAKPPQPIDIAPFPLMNTPTSSQATATGHSIQPTLAHATDLADVAIGVTAQLARDGSISDERETELVRLVFARQDDILLLAKHYGHNAKKFLQLSQFLPALATTALQTNVPVSLHPQPDAIIIGSGLAGLTAALNILDRGGRVVVLEKEHLLGGNSNKASSGINGCCFGDGDPQDSIKGFENDTIRSAGTSAQQELIETLVNNSASAVTWLKERVGVDLSLRAQLGGHSHKRTHRPKSGMVGAEVIYAMQKAVKSYEKSGKVKILVDSKVIGLLKENDRVIGVEYKNTATAASNETFQLLSPNVVLATGGFAADRSTNSLLAQYRPELLNMATTAGEFSTGDGISIATSLGAGLVDMDKVQIHPTGWVDPSDPNKKSKVLAAELMRGVGGILINKAGKRFCNELGTRAYVTEKMLSHDKNYMSTKKWQQNAEVPSFFLVLSASAVDDGRKHVDHYSHKGLMTKLNGVTALAQWMGLPRQILVTTLSRYIRDAKRGRDEFGKKFFPGLPSADLEKEMFFAGTVTPVLHYCMGGVTIDSQGNVLDEGGKIIPGLHAAGEVTGGVHGDNRLGGNSLLECTVYGTIVGQKIPVAAAPIIPTESPSLTENDVASTTKQLKLISREELQLHNKPNDCWVAINNVVYDLTDFALEHPAGAESIYKLGGQDGTTAFEAIHNQNMLADVEEDKVGMLLADAPSNARSNHVTVEGDRGVTVDELKHHNRPGDCWVAFHGQVYNMSHFAPSHPGGEQLILNVAGTDGTNAFDNVHSKKKLNLVEDERIGTLLD